MRTVVFAIASSALGCFAASSSPGGTSSNFEDAAIVDASTREAEPISDAADARISDGEADVAVGEASHWCDNHLGHIFCDDFDENALAQGWDNAVNQGSTMTLSGITYTSPAQSLFTSTPAIMTGGAAIAQLDKRFVELSSHIRVAYDLHPDALDSSGARVAVTSIQLTDDGGTLLSTLNLMLSSGGASVEEYEPSLDGGGAFHAVHPCSAAPPVGAWSHLEIDVTAPVDAGIGEGTVAVLLGGVVVLDDAPLGPAIQPSLPFVFLGLVVQGLAQAVAVRFDDVTIDVAAN